MKRTKATWFVTGFLTGFLMFIAASESEAECADNPPTHPGYVHGVLEYRSNGNVWMRVTPFYSCLAFEDIEQGTCGCIFGEQNEFFCQSNVPQETEVREGAILVYVGLTVHGPATGLDFEPGSAVEFSGNPVTVNALGGDALCADYRWLFPLVQATGSTELEKAFREAFEEQEERVVYLGKVTGSGWCFASVLGPCLSDYRYAPQTPVNYLSIGGVFLEGDIAVELWPEMKVITGSGGGNGACHPECGLAPPKAQAGENRAWGAVKRLFN